MLLRAATLPNPSCWEFSARQELGLDHKRRAHRHLVWSVTLPVAHRVVEVLRELAHAHGTEVVGGTRIDLPLSQDALSSLVGATRESVNRAVRQLTASGALRRAGRCYVLPPKHHPMRNGQS